MIKYQATKNTPELISSLSSLYDNTFSTYALLTMLGDYWSKYYTDFEALAFASSGCVVALSSEVKHLYSDILKSNIFDIPCNEVDQLSLLKFSGNEYTITWRIPVDSSLSALDVIAWEDNSGTKHNIVITEDIICTGYIELTSDYTGIKNTTVYQYKKGKYTALEVTLSKYSINFTVEGLRDISFLTSTLFEPKVILEKNIHYTIDSSTGTISFLVDIFDDESINEGTYKFSDTVREISTVIFWGVNVALSSYFLYDRYGISLYKKKVDSYSYKQIILGLMYFYINIKGVKNLQNVIDIVYGAPIAATDGETVTSISLVDSNLEAVDFKDDYSYYKIVTTNRTYYAYSYGTLLVHKGDTLSQFQLLVSYHECEDYLSDSTWLDTVSFPSELVESDTLTVDKTQLLKQVLKYNLVFFKFRKSFVSDELYNKFIDNISDIISDGLPVYLYPLIRNVYKISDEEPSVVEDITIDPSKEDDSEDDEPSSADTRDLLEADLTDQGYLFFDSPREEVNLQINTYYEFGDAFIANNNEHDYSSDSDEISSCEQFDKFEGVHDATYTYSELVCKEHDGEKIYDGGLHLYPTEDPIEKIDVPIVKVRLSDTYDYTTLLVYDGTINANADSIVHYYNELNDVASPLYKVVSNEDEVFGDYMGTLTFSIGNTQYKLASQDLYDNADITEAISLTSEQDSDVIQTEFDDPSAIFDIKVLNKTGNVVLSEEVSD